MKRTATSILFAIIALAVFGYGYFEYHTAKARLDEKDQDIELLQADLQQTTQRKAAWQATAIELETENARLQDSITTLNAVIARLHTTISEKNKAIRKLKGRIKRREVKYEKLKEEIAALSRDYKANETKIAALEAEKKQLRQQMETFNREQANLVAVRGDAKRQQEQQLDRVTHLSALQQLVTSTEVSVHTVALRSSRYGRNIGHLSSDASKSNWRYTIFGLKLKHDDMVLLLDEQFEVRIQDLDTGEYLKHTTGKQSQEGLQFKYDGNLIEGVFVNSQPKASGNYELRVFYLGQDGKYLLHKSGHKIVADKKPLNI